jgi:hypothetical protein
MASRFPKIRFGHGAGVWGWLLPGALLLAAQGCVLGNDSDPPKLNVDLYWDRAPQSDRFSSGVCSSAGVVWMDWTLTRDGKEIASSDEGGVECEDAFAFVDLSPGVYDLEVVGYDGEEQARWNSNCEGLELGRFDVLYQCDIDQSESD